MKKVLVIGATSAIAAETARCFAAEGAELFLCGRDGEKLARLADDLRVRGAAAVFTARFDASDLTLHEVLLEKALDQLGEIEAVLLAYGALPDQAACELSWSEAATALTTNLTSPLCFLTLLGNYFAHTKRGNITVISSVAGDRGRQSNYVYGTAKAALSTFLQGLRNRLAPLGVSVTTIKPGFVDTPMTADIKKTPLFASPVNVGARIHRAMKRGEDVVYTPWFWGPIMCALRGIPENVFKRMKL